VGAARSSGGQAAVVKPAWCVAAVTRSPTN
jgi:hypothetical protein